MSCKVPFPHCSKVTWASQGKKKKLTVFKVNEGHPSPQPFASLFVFLQDLLSFFAKIISPSWTSQFRISLSNSAAIKAIFAWAASVSFLRFPQTVHLLSGLARTSGKAWLPHSSTLANAKSSRDALEISSSHTLHHQLSCYLSLISPSLHTQLCLYKCSCSKTSYLGLASL